VISLLLSNVLLHHVLDEWFESEARPRLKGRGSVVRFADDAILAFETYHDAKRVLDVLGHVWGKSRKGKSVVRQVTANAAVT
jgi:hypothetical protein